MLPHLRADVVSVTVENPLTPYAPNAPGVQPCPSPRATVGGPLARLVVNQVARGVHLGARTIRKATEYTSEAGKSNAGNAGRRYQASDNSHTLDKPCRSRRRNPREPRHHIRAGDTSPVPTRVHSRTCRAVPMHLEPCHRLVVRIRLEPGDLVEGFRYLLRRSGARGVLPFGFCRQPVRMLRIALVEIFQEDLDRVPGDLFHCPIRFRGSGVVSTWVLTALRANASPLLRISRCD